jgi:hypothetical protein
MNPYDLAAVQALQRGEPVDTFHETRWSEPVRLLVAAMAKPKQPAAPTPVTASENVFIRMIAKLED